MLGKAWLPAILFCAVASPGWAQFTELASTDNGQELYFSSPLRIEPATATFPESRVFHAGPNGIQLFAERGALTPVSPGFISGGGIGKGSFLIPGAIPAPGSNLRMQTSSQPAPCDWIKPAEIGETREIGIGGSHLRLILNGQCSEVSIGGQITRRTQMFEQAK
jgi:hypothetical protein